MPAARRCARRGPVASGATPNACTRCTRPACTRAASPTPASAGRGVSVVFAGRLCIVRDVDGVVHGVAVSAVDIGVVFAARCLAGLLLLLIALADLCVLEIELLELSPALLGERLVDAAGRPGWKRVDHGVVAAHVRTHGRVLRQAPLLYFFHVVVFHAAEDTGGEARPQGLARALAVPARALRVRRPVFLFVRVRRPLEVGVQRRLWDLVVVVEELFGFGEGVAVVDLRAELVRVLAANC